VPSRARDVLLEIASTGAYRPLWPGGILDEPERTLRTLLGKRGISPAETDARLFRQLRTVFADAPMTGWERPGPTIELPDPDDGHVVAANPGRPSPRDRHRQPRELSTHRAARVPLTRQSLDEARASGRALRVSGVVMSHGPGRRPRLTASHLILITGDHPPLARLPAPTLSAGQRRYETLERAI
jgi:hypothetical protein